MADRGAIGKLCPGDIDARLVLPWYERGVLLTAASPGRQDGTLSGIVQESGVNVVGVRVNVLHRPTGRIIATALTDANGAWSIGGLNPTTPEAYAVWILDPAGGTAYNDAIFALITPST